MISLYFQPVSMHVVLDVGYCYMEQKCANTVGTVWVPWAGYGSLGWLFPMLKCKYIFPIKSMEAILSNSTRKLLWFEIIKMLTAIINLLCYFL